MGVNLRKPGLVPRAGLVPARPPTKRYQSDRYATQAEFALNLAKGVDNEAAMFVEAQAQLFGAFPEVIAIDGTRKRFIFHTFLDRTDLKGVEAPIRPYERACNEKTAKLIRGKEGVLHKTLPADTRIIGVRQDRSNERFRKTALPQDFRAELRMSLVGIAFIIEVMKQPCEPPEVFILPVTAGLRAHSAFDRARVFAQAVTERELTEQIPGFLAFW